MTDPTPALESMDFIIDQTKNVLSAELHAHLSIAAEYARQAHKEAR